MSFHVLPRKIWRCLKRPWAKDAREERPFLRPTMRSNPMLRKALEAVIIILFPEYEVLKGVEEFTIARMIQHRTREVHDWEQFSLQQAHLVRMGGIHIPHLQRPDQFPQFIMQNAHVMQFHRFPNENQITLRARTDIIDKIIALHQAFYFLSSVAIRSTGFYRISLLELITLNYIGYASVTYLLRLKKPQDLFEPFELDLLDLPSPSVPLDIDNTKHPRLEKWTWLGVIICMVAINSLPFAVLSKRQSPFSNAKSKNGEGELTKVAIVGTLAILAWLLRRRLEHHPWKRNTLFRTASWYTCVVFMYAIMLAYAGYRIYLLCMVFGGFERTAEGVYLTPSSWTRYLGHVGA